MGFRSGFERFNRECGKTGGKAAVRAGLLIGRGGGQGDVSKPCGKEGVFFHNGNGKAFFQIDRKSASFFPQWKSEAVFPWREKIRMEKRRFFSTMEMGGHFSR